MNIDGLMYIYKLESPIGELYIGQTKNWSLRFKSYKNKIECLMCIIVV